MVRRNIDPPPPTADSRLTTAVPPVPVLPVLVLPVLVLAAPLAPALITAAALEHRCPGCVETLDMFVDAYGA